jgi:NADP-dependent 3-hydroxy acid dehydrogenase YdfG
VNPKKVVAITGASSGIGQATARLLAKQGHAVVLGARREGVLAALVTELSGSGGLAHYRVTDVTRRADLEALVAQAVERFGWMRSSTTLVSGQSHASTRCASKIGTQ